MKNILRSLTVYLMCLPQEWSLCREKRNNAKLRTRYNRRVQFILQQLKSAIILVLLGQFDEGIYSKRKLLGGGRQTNGKLSVNYILNADNLNCCFR